MDAAFAAVDNIIGQVRAARFFTDPAQLDYKPEERSQNKCSLTAVEVFRVTTGSSPGFEGIVDWKDITHDAHFAVSAEQPRRATFISLGSTGRDGHRFCVLGFAGDTDRSYTTTGGYTVRVLDDAPALYVILQSNAELTLYNTPKLYKLGDEPIVAMTEGKFRRWWEDLALAVQKQEFEVLAGLLGVDVIKANVKHSYIQSGLF